MLFLKSHSSIQAVSTEPERNYSWSHQSAKVAIKPELFVIIAMTDSVILAFVMSSATSVASAQITVPETSISNYSILVALLVVAVTILIGIFYRLLSQPRQSPSTADNLEISSKSRELDQLNRHAQLRHSSHPSSNNSIQQSDLSNSPKAAESSGIAALRQRRQQLLSGNDSSHAKLVTKQPKSSFRTHRYKLEQSCHPPCLPECQPLATLEELLGKQFKLNVVFMLL